MNIQEFFNNIYHRFLLAQRSEMRCICLRAMAIVYERHCISIGSFADTKHVVQMLAKCTNLAERDHLILLINKVRIKFELFFKQQRSIEKTRSYVVVLSAHLNIKN